MKIEAVDVTPSVRLQFVSYKKAKTQATLLTDLKPGDILRIEFQFGDDNNRYGQAARVFLVNETQGTSVVKYAAATYGALLRMNLEEVVE